MPNIRGKYLISTCLGYDFSGMCQIQLLLLHLTCLYFASAIIWNKEQGKLCSKSIIIGTIIHTFWQLWYARFIWTLWMHFEWCQTICFGWRRLVILCSMLRLILFDITHKKSSYSMYGFSHCLFIQYVTERWCSPKKTRCILSRNCDIYVIYISKCSHGSVKKGIVQSKKLDI